MSPIDRPRVPMPAKPGDWIKEDDVKVSLSERTPQYGRRFSMDINELLLAQVGARALEHAVEQLGKHVAYEHQDEIHRVVAAAIFDLAWARPIIEQELRLACRQMVLSLWSDDEKKNLRDWFDLFTAILTKDDPPRNV